MVESLSIDDVLGILQAADNDDDAGDAGNQQGRGGRRPGAGRRRGRGGRAPPANAAPGRCQGRGRARGRLGRGLRRVQREKRKRNAGFKRRQDTVDRQAQVFNRSGRSRNQDYHFPSHSDQLKRKATTGKSKWKEWSPEAVLRASENSSRREAGTAIDGAGKTGAHAGQSRFVVAQSIASGQQKGIEQVRARGCEMLVRNLMFDESTFDLSIDEPAATNWSVLCSHAQWTYKLRGADSVQDNHIVRSPQVLVPVMNSVTMDRSLREGPGGFACNCNDVDFVATVTTCDAHAANLRMLRFWEQQLPEDHLFLPNLCIQHRTGNVVEQLTKLVGNLGGNFSVAKVLNKAHLLKRLRRRVSDRVKTDLSVLGAVPPAVQQEWAQAKLHARQLADLCLSFDDDPAQPAREGTLRRSFQDLLEFFAAPWTGPGCLQLTGILH